MHKDKCQWVLEFSQLLCNNIGNDHIMRIIVCIELKSIKRKHIEITHCITNGYAGLVEYPKRVMKKIHENFNYITKKTVPGAQTTQIVSYKFRAITFTAQKYFLINFRFRAVSLLSVDMHLYWVALINFPMSKSPVDPIKMQYELNRTSAQKASIRLVKFVCRWGFSSFR